MSVYQRYRGEITDICLWCRCGDEPGDTWVAHPEATTGVRTNTQKLVDPMHFECANDMFSGNQSFHFCLTCRVPVNPFDPRSDLVIKPRVVRLDENRKGEMMLMMFFATILPFCIAIHEYNDIGKVGVNSLLVTGPMVAGLLVGKDVMGVVRGKKREGMTFVAGVVTLVTAAILAAIDPYRIPMLFTLDVTLGLHLLSWTADDFSNAQTRRIKTFATAVFSAMIYGIMTGWSNDMMLYGIKLSVSAMLIVSMASAGKVYEYIDAQIMAADGQE